MEPTQTINLIALSLIVVMHAGVLALRLGMPSLNAKTPACITTMRLNAIRFIV